MNVKIPLLLLLLLAGTVGYLLGTESGRQQRDAITAKIKNRCGDDAVEAASESTGNAEETADAGVS